MLFYKFVYIYIYYWNVDNVGYYLVNIGFVGVYLVYDISGMII